MAITLQDAGGGYDPIAQFVGGELFPSFESSLFAEGGEGGGYGGFQGAGFGAGGASVTVAQDISELFGSHWTAPEEERFDGEGDAMERRFRCACLPARLCLPVAGSGVLSACLPGRHACRPGCPFTHHLPPTACPCWVLSCSTELERLRSQGVEAPRDRGDMFFGGGQDETFSPGAAQLTYSALGL